MRGGEGQIGEEGAVAAVFHAVLQVVDHAVDIELRGILEIRRQLLQQFAVVPVGGDGVGIRGVGGLHIAEVAGVGEHGEGAVEAPLFRAGLRREAEVPFAGHVGSVARVLQQGGEGGDALVQVAFVAGHAFLIGREFLGEVAEPGEVAVHAAQQHGAGGGAGRGGDELAQFHALFGQGIEMGRGDFAAEAAQVGEAHIVNDNQEDVRRGIRPGALAAAVGAAADD